MMGEDKVVLGVLSRYKKANFLTRKEEPQVSSHALRDPLEDQVLGLLGAVHAHSLPVLCEMVLPRLLLQGLLRLRGKRHDRKVNAS